MKNQVKDSDPTRSSVEVHDVEASHSAEEYSPLLVEVADGEDTSGNGNQTSQWSHEAEFDRLPRWRRPSIYWLLPGFFIYSLAFGGTLVPRLNLILTLVCREFISEQAVLHPEFSFVPVTMFGDNPQCKVPQVQALATKFTLYMSLISGILSAATSPKIGALSDRYGRKYLLSICIFGGLLSEIVTILAATYEDTVHYHWLLLGAFFEGISGSFITGLALTHSYAADCTPPSKRGVAFGYFHACLFGGISLGPFIAAYIVKSTGSLINVFWLAFACHAAFFLYLIFVVPESLSQKRQLAAMERHRIENETASETSIFRALKAANFLEPLKILYPTGPGSSSQIRANLLLLSTVNTIIFGVAMGTGTVLIFYTNYAFDWGDYETQMFVGTTNACRVTALIVLLPLLNYIFRTRYENKAQREGKVQLSPKTSGSDNVDLYTIRVALAFEIIGYAGFASAKIGRVFFTSGIFAASGGIASPILQSALSKHVPHDRVGQLLGALGLLNALARIVCPTVFGLIYASTVSTFPQSVFLVVCAVFVVGFVVSWFVKPHIYLEDDGTTPSSTDHGEYTDLLSDELADEDIIRA